MLEIKTIRELRSALKEERARGKKIGFVPTMGYMHEGHLALMREANRLADVVVVSIFVNPTQFGPNEDLGKYPRDIEGDRDKAAGVGVDFLFVPAVKEMYSEGYSTYVEVTGEMTHVLCGRSRPGHFKGVTTVVAKLLNIVEPDIALFGNKDWQQLAVIKRMVRDLNMDVEIIGVPTVRENGGLAMSSRNTYLSLEERKAALVLSKALRLAQDMVRTGKTNAGEIAAELKETIENEGLIEVEYLEVCDPESLSPVETIEANTLIAVAARVGKARLIDNALIVPES
ncbi:MAG: pantoate--beta-alanine ligase [Candidatus Aquicultor secundus]|uniref:Pantothenate synthetase n=1 Tax=Candidatus Aquicultor secundus TaxID=1973895 RepID=A0A2M7T6L8_9ACTN|nr:pantoate--beta-alanine ligase [Candidatus Aquicultor secundus]NCO66626.1 pantoate--beta-alanine ligase [Solirubrobacter sp.]OIO83591.1 MAG: pantoate--beta-alanine ligase [Candidatus Aquicultor secundus]PIU26032.1 MAG: pantoate--beta-alanine ligase [Candidatus Aquicultor secundus]PIW22596.1 MAG: pantoate--beta-alanine ligase [Candidatus Aquicultor secundus]PIX51248.1 MAG: pantoate--beta-alanine ligase [Candidatus Aquicultor secundus]